MALLILPSEFIFKNIIQKTNFVEKDIDGLKCSTKSMEDIHKEIIELYASIRTGTNISFEICKQRRTILRGLILRCEGESKLKKEMWNFEKRWSYGDPKVIYDFISRIYDLPPPAIAYYDKLHDLYNVLSAPIWTVQPYKYILFSDVDIFIEETGIRSPPISKVDLKENIIYPVLPSKFKRKSEYKEDDIKQFLKIREKKEYSSYKFKLTSIIVAIPGHHIMAYLLINNKWYHYSFSGLTILGDGSFEQMKKANDYYVVMSFYIKGDKVS